MKPMKSLTALAIAAMLAACGGGAATPATSSAPVAAAPATMTDPLTGASAPGEPIALLHGNAPAHSTVTAYRVLSDGSNGAPLGAPATANANGDFELRLGASGTPWIRVRAQGGNYLRSVDNTLHPVESLELVTPYVTTSFDFFVLTPVSDAASRIMAYRARAGASLPEAFKASMRSMLELDLANLPFLDDVSVYLSMLKGSVVSARGYNSAQTTNQIKVQIGIDRLGVLLDLPSSAVWEALAAAGERGFHQNALDGNGNPILVGTWSGGVYDRTHTVSLQELVNQKVMEEIKVTDARTGARVAPTLKELVSRHLLLEFAVDGACTQNNAASLAASYPFYPTNGGKVDPANCTEVRRRVADWSSRLATNNTWRWK